ncbi:MAG: hypothetical protein GY757_25950 [bacterium]|nr:hypothetical protein [bacterium]
MQKHIRLKHILFLMTMILILLQVLPAQGAGVPGDTENGETTRVPLYAVDKNGKPVFDLKMEDLELFVDGKPRNISKLVPFNADTPEPERVIIIVADELHGSGYGLARTKKIAAELIRQGSKEDQFIVLGIAIDGARHIAGPEKRNDGLLKKVEKMKLVPGKQVRLNRLTRENAWRTFKVSASQVKYAVRNIRKPKIFYLISEGIGERRGGERGRTRRAWINKDYENDPNPLPSSYRSPSSTTGNPRSRSRMSYYYGEILQDLEEGGCVVNTIYPGRRCTVSAFARRFIYFFTKPPNRVIEDMALGSGSAFFSQTDVPKMLADVKKTSAPYYELLYPENLKKGERRKISIKSKNKDVNIQTQTHIDAKEEYKDMDKYQKKTFAINVATGGGWSRIVGKVEKAGFEILEKKKKEKQKHYKIRVQIPEAMRNKKADVFLICFDSKYEKSAILFAAKKLQDKEEFELGTRKGKKLLYFVIIEPGSMHSVFSRVK